MPGFLTTASVMMCPHGGNVQAISGNTQVMAGGAPILRSSDTFIVAGCAFMIWIWRDNKSRCGTAKAAKIAS